MRGARKCMTGGNGTAREQLSNPQKLSDQKAGAPDAQADASMV
jgi:hypothetical protein